MEILLWIVAVACVVVGVAGAVLPAVPGPVLVFGGLFLAAWAEGFVYVGWGTIAVLALLTVLAYAVDFGASVLGARRVGASKSGLVGAMVGTVAGLPLGLPGILLGPFIGATIGELTARKDLRAAGRVGMGTWLGLVLGAALELTLVFLMIGIFLIAQFF